MRFGLFTRFPRRAGLSDAEAFDECFQVVRATEDLGFDVVWLGEEHFSPDLFLASSVLTIAGAVAASTTRLRVGLAVVPLPLGHPLRIAEEAATVDQISRGRLEFGIGRSSNIQSYMRYDIPYTESRGRMLESLEVIKKAWTQDRFSHQGEFYHFEDISLAPRPFQKPHPPIYMAVTNPETYPLAGSLGYSISVGPRGDREQLQRNFEEYHSAWVKAGHPGSGKIVARLLIYVAETGEQARSDPEDGTMAMLQFQSRMFVPLEGLSEELNRARVERSQYLANVTYDQVLRTDVTYGTPEFVADTLQGYRDELGVHDFMLDMNCYGSLPMEKMLSSMRLFSERVMPKLR